MVSDLVKKILFLSAILTMPMLSADQHSDENRLLKSWGFEFSTQGLLIFKSTSKKQSEYQPWNPELLNHQLVEPEKNTTKILQPLVISSKNNTKN